MKLFWIAASVADIEADNPIGDKTLYATNKGTLFKPATINSQGKLRNLPSWLVFFIVLLFNKILLFRKTSFYDILYFIIC